MEASRVTDFSALNMEPRKNRWMRFDISTEERETGQLNGPQGCPGSRHRLCPLNINWLCGVCAAAGTVCSLRRQEWCRACSPNAYSQKVLREANPPRHPCRHWARNETSLSEWRAAAASGSWYLPNPPTMASWFCRSDSSKPREGRWETWAWLPEEIYEGRDRLEEAPPETNCLGSHSGCLHLWTSVFGFSMEEVRVWLKPLAGQFLKINCLYFRQSGECRFAQLDQNKVWSPHLLLPISSKAG